MKFVFGSDAVGRKLHWQDYIDQIKEARLALLPQIPNFTLRMQKTTLLFPVCGC
jgi:hypothetical protein